MATKNQIRTLIAIRDEHKMTQDTLYNRIGSIIGRFIGRLKHLKNNEAKRAIEELAIPRVSETHAPAPTIISEIISEAPIISSAPDIQPPDIQPKTKEQELAEKIEKLFGKKKS